MMIQIVIKIIKGDDRGCDKRVIIQGLIKGDEIG